MHLSVCHFRGSLDIQDVAHPFKKFVGCYICGHVRRFIHCFNDAKIRNLFCLLDELY